MGIAVHQCLSVPKPKNLKQMAVNVFVDLMCFNYDTENNVFIRMQTCFFGQIYRELIYIKNNPQIRILEIF